MSFYKSWFLLFFKKHNSDVYPIFLKLSREPSDITGGNENGAAAVENILVCQKVEHGVNHMTPQFS